MSKIIAIASDHAGSDLKNTLQAHLEYLGYQVLDLGTNSKSSVDYPDYANMLAQKIQSQEATRGVLICGSGIGISIAANRHKWIRAALCSEPLSSKLARQHNDANVLVLGARMIGTEIAKECLNVFLATEFEGGRHQKRVDKLS
jgi:ribose 5-phosphate isomerase B